MKKISLVAFMALFSLSCQDPIDFVRLALEGLIDKATDKVTEEVTDKVTGGNGNAYTIRIRYEATKEGVPKYELGSITATDHPQPDQFVDLPYEITYQTTSIPPYWSAQFKLKRGILDLPHLYNIKGTLEVTYPSSGKTERVVLDNIYNGRGRITLKFNPNL